MRVHGIDERYESSTTRTTDGDWRKLNPKGSTVVHDHGGVKHTLTNAESDLFASGVSIDYLLSRRKHPTWPSRPPNFKPRSR